ncbi:MAG: TonB-dependent receptor plug domain-containing protein [Anaeromyxobacteraceae bacterium]
MRTAQPRRSLVRTLAALAVLAAAVPRAGEAQEAPDPADRVDIATIDLNSLLEGSVEAVGLHEERISDAPAAVFVLTGDDVRRHGFRTLDEALRTVPGLFGYADGLYPMTGVRGMGLPGDYTTRLLVLVDGHPLNNSVGIGESYLGRDLPVPLAAVRRIEVIKGPVGSVYGPTAFLGVVNLVTAGGPARTQVVAGGDAAQGSLRAGTASAVTSGEVAGVSYVASAEGFDTRGLDQAFPELARATDRAAPPGGVVRGVDFARSLQSYARASWRDLTLSASCGTSHRGLASAAYSSVVEDPRNVLDNRTCFAQLGWRRAVTPSLTLQARASYDDFEYGDTLAYPAPPAGFGRFEDRGRDHWFSADVRAEWRAGGTHLIAGTTAEQHDTAQRSYSVALPSLVEDPVNGVGVGVIEKDFRSATVYALLEQDIGPQLTLHAGVTLHAHEIFGARVTPKAAAVWHPTRDDTVKAIFSEGFRAPTASEAFFEDGATYLANPALHPETVRSLELVYERRVGAAVSLAASLFQDDYRDLIRFQSVPAPGLDHAPDVATPTDFRQEPRNDGALRLRGAEVGAIVRHGDLFHAWGGFSTQALDTAPSANFPDLTASFAAWARTPWRPLSVALNGAYVAARAMDPTAATLDRSRAVGRSFLLNALAALEVPGARGLTIELGVQNLTDAAAPDPVPGDFAPISHMNQPARTFRAGLRWRAQ